MNRGDRPDLCVYHGPGCLDGFASAWAIWSKWPDVEFLPAQYGDALPLEQAAGKNVLIVDFSYSEPGMRELAAVAQSVTVLDHHEGAKEALETLFAENVIHGVFDQDHSGAWLAWQYAWAGMGTPKLIEHVQDRDLWKFEAEGTHEVCAAIASYPADFTVWKDLVRQLESPAHRVILLAEGAAIIRAEGRMLDQILAATTFMGEISGHTVPVANVPYMLASAAGHILSKDQPFAAVYFDQGDGQRKFSLRSAPEGLDVNKIAKGFGGGGHVHAAGFSVPSDWLPPVRGKKGVVEVSNG